MDRNDFIIALMIALQLFWKLMREKERLRAAQLELEEKHRELSLRKVKKQRILAKEAAQQKLFDGCMVFIEAIEDNNLEIVHKFDENSMMNTIAAMLDGDGGGGDGDSGGFTADYGHTHPPPETVLNLAENSSSYGAVATFKRDGSCGGDTGVLAGESGAGQSTDEQAVNVAFDKTDNKDRDGGGDNNSCDCDRRK